MSNAEPDPTRFEPMPVTAPLRVGRRWDQLRRSPALTWAAIAMVRRAAPRQFAFSIVLQVAVAGFVGVQLLLAKGLITELVALGEGADFATGTVIPVFAGLIVTMALAGGATAILGHQQALLGEVVSHHTMADIIDVASSVDLARYEDSVFYDHLERARNAAMFRPTHMVTSVSTLLTAALTSVGVAVALATLEPILLPLVLVAGIPVLLVALHNSRQTYLFEYGMTAHAREHDHLLELLTGRDSAKELRVFDAIGYLRRRYDALTKERVDRFSAFLRGRAIVSLIGTAGTALATGFALGALVWLLATGRTDVATAVTAAVAMQVLAARLVTMTSSLGRVVESGMFLDDYQSFLELKRRPDLLQRGTGDERPPSEPFEGLRVEHLSFAYPNTDRRVLGDVSLEINPGEVIALVGENGSGKTTLVKLLCQLYRDWDEGRIVWNGKDVTELDPRVIQDRMTVLFQDFVRYDLTVADNIALGRSELADGGADRVEEAARQARAEALIAQLPRSFQTRLGRQFFGGFELSGGQWQRLALARAFFRGGDFLVLDEPTSALDPRGEHELFEQMRTLAAGKAVLLISHRFSSVRMADRIYVLDEGRIVEQGTHEQLIEADGLYAELYSLQATAYFGAERS
jgi:ATP-binding cassette subfamily B protein